MAPRTYVPVWTVHVGLYAVRGLPPRWLCSRCRSIRAREGLAFGERLEVGAPGPACQECGRQHGEEE